MAGKKTIQEMKKLKITEKEVPEERKIQKLTWNSENQKKPEDSEDQTNRPEER